MSFADTENTQRAAVESFIDLARAVIDQAGRQWPSWSVTPHKLRAELPAHLRRTELANVLAQLHMACNAESFVEPLLPLAARLYDCCGLTPYGACTPEGSPSLDEAPNRVARFLIDYALRAIAWGIADLGVPPPTNPDWGPTAQRAIRAWQSPHVDWLTVAYLKGARPKEYQPLDLMPNLRLETPMHAAHCVVEDPSLPWVGSAAFTMGVMLLRTRVKKLEPRTEWHTASVNALRQYLTLLRLVRAGRYGIEEIRVVPAEEFFQTGPLPQWAFHVADLAPSPYGPYDSVEITATDASDCAGLMTAWANRKLEQLDVPLHRFAMAASRIFPEDALIDLVIAMEGSLLAGNDKDQLKHRCAMRGAHLLGDEEDPVEMSKLLKCAYDARSSIVHGAKRLRDLSMDKRAGLNSVAFVAKCEEVVRRVLVKFVERAAQGIPPKQFAASLDDAILRSSDRRPPS